ncbi:MAG TPA: hypothetical protein VNA04_18440 [Thermoanaerobaculia bacterium]|nr:hypothetical protein [Thermoanaerobaculia bacterium]
MTSITRQRAGSAQCQESPTGRLRAMKKFAPWVAGLAVLFWIGTAMAQVL